MTPTGSAGHGPGPKSGSRRTRTRSPGLRSGASLGTSSTGRGCLPSARPSDAQNGTYERRSRVCRTPFCSSQSFRICRGSGGRYIPAFRVIIGPPDGTSTARSHTGHRHVSRIVRGGSRRQSHCHAWPTRPATPSSSPGLLGNGMTVPCGFRGIHRGATRSTSARPCDGADGVLTYETRRKPSQVIVRTGARECRLRGHYLEGEALGNAPGPKPALWDTSRFRAAGDSG